MKQIKNIISISLYLIIIVSSCSSEQDDTAMTSEPAPAAAALIFPENNTECNEGTVINETETDVLFQWQEATNASSYILQITNLNDNRIQISALENHRHSNGFQVSLLLSSPNLEFRQLSIDET